jgi:hypothetical protein
MGYVIGLLLAGLLAWACVALAKSKGRDPVVWGICGFFFGFLTLIVLLFMPSLQGEQA